MILHAIAIVIITVIVGIMGVVALDRPPTWFAGGADSSSLTPLQDEVRKKYAHLKLRSRGDTKREVFNAFCFPKEFRLQEPQRFIGEFIGKGSRNMNLLGFHKIGAGKTCASITAAETFLGSGPAKDSRVMVVMPASLLPGFRNELRGRCPSYQYITEEEREKLTSAAPGSAQYNAIIAQSNERIDARYILCSYNRFITEGHKYNTRLLIIDEVQNVVKSGGVCNRMLIEYITARPQTKLLVFSATPIFDSPGELTDLLRLMRQDISDELAAGLITNPAADPESRLAFDKSKEMLAKTVSGLVSYYAGAPAVAFPRATINITVCRMSKFQSGWYVAQVESEMAKTGVREVTINDNFYIKSRARSNIVFPQGLSGTDGLPLMARRHLTEQLGEYSCKFQKMLRRLRKGELSFVYSNFVSFGGIRTLMKILDANGWCNFLVNGPGHKRYAIWTGQQTSAERDLIRATFNHPDNDNARQLQIIIGSPSMREGVSLFRVRQVHCVEPYWNHSRLQQVFGRANRFCSHKSLPAADRLLDIYLYVAIIESSRITAAMLAEGETPIIDPAESVDGYILSLANRKKMISDEILEVLIDSAVDKGLGYGRN